MPTTPTGAERYFAERRQNETYEAEYKAARNRIDSIDSVLRMMDQRRCELSLTKSDLAHRANLRPEAIRRLFSTENPNPTLSTLTSIADALELDLMLHPRQVATTSAHDASE